MHAGAPNAVQIGDAIGYLLLGAAALFFAITGPKYLHLIDKGFPQKRRVNPEAAAKQARYMRTLAALLAFCCLCLVASFLFRYL